MIAKPKPPPETTRAALLRAALELFGSQGYQGTSIREIAAAADSNIASIAYHFGGKEGLRVACADHVVGLLQQIAAPVLDLNVAQSPEDSGKNLSPDDARSKLVAMEQRMVHFLLSAPEAKPLVPFMLREMSDPSPVMDRIFTGVIEPVHRRLCQLWQDATGEPAESEQVRLTIFTLIGQIIYFRIGREVVLRRMQWPSYTEDRTEKIAGIIAANLEAVLSPSTQDQPSPGSSPE